MATTHLAKAKVRKNDEYYTTYETVQTEIENYLKGQPDLFKDAVVYLPADNPYRAQSAFYCYFKNNFFRLKLKKLISVGYNAASNGIQSYGFVYTLTRDNESGSSFTEHSYLLEGSGDFQSHECRAFWEEATHVITNPPFSKIKDFIEYCVHFGVFYSFITPIINIQYRRLFQLIWKQLAWLGTTETNTFLTQNPDNPTEMVARPIVHCVWFTNIKKCFHKCNTIAMRSAPKTMKCIACLVYHERRCSVLVEWAPALPPCLYWLVCKPLDHLAYCQLTDLF